MRITKLVLKDYKCFENLVLDNLGNRVVLVGPNGSGKSAVLEAIAVLKEYVGTYDPNRSVHNRTIPLANRHGPAWPAEVPMPIRGDQPFAVIEARVELADEEAKICEGTPSADVSVKIERTGIVTPSVPSPKISELFRYFDPDSRIGVVDYIAPHRTFPLLKVSNLTMDSISLDQQRRELIELPRNDFDYQKYKSVKQFILSQEMKDFTHRRAAGQDRDSLGLLRELFASFFAPKTLIGFRPYANEMQVAVSTPYGTHDLDQLSSGERELFFILVSLYRIRHLPSVVLYDEPERHLNAGLEAKLIPALEKLQSKNQIWIATHGLELIGSVPIQEIVALNREAGSTLPERFTDESTADRVRLFEQLGAKVGLQCSASRVVFLEGENSHKDKRILDKLAGPRLPAVLFVPSGPSEGVLGAGTRAGLLIEKASRHAAFLMVLDRDYRDDQSVGYLQRKLNDRVFVWNCHEIENILLVPEILLQILKSYGVEQITGTQQVLESLLDVARGLQERFVYQWTIYRLSMSVRPQKDGVPGCPQDEASFRQLVEGRQKYHADLYAAPRVEEELTAAKENVARCLSNDSWIQVLPGKEILTGFRKKYLNSLRQELFVEQIISQMIERGSILEEVNRLIQFINAH